MNLIRVDFKSIRNIPMRKKPRQKQFYKNTCLSLTNFQTPIYLTHLPQQFSYICIQISSPYMYAFGSLMSLQYIHVLELYTELSRVMSEVP